MMSAAPENGLSTGKENNAAESSEYLHHFPEFTSPGIKEFLAFHRRRGIRYLDSHKKISLPQQIRLTPSTAIHSYTRASRPSSLGWLPPSYSNEAHYTDQRIQRLLPGYKAIWTGQVRRQVNGYDVSGKPDRFVCLQRPSEPYFSNSLISGSKLRYQFDDNGKRFVPPGNKPSIRRCLLDKLTYVEDLQDFLDSVYLVDQEATVWYDNVIHESSAKRIIALDCEGKNLGRNGELSVITIYDGARSWIFDCYSEYFDVFKLLLRDVLSNHDIVKVVHDSRMDSDALYHLMGIELHEVFDTSSLETYNQRYIAATDTLTRHSLNSTLALNNIPRIACRDGPSIYESNPDYWLQRPVNSEMVTRSAHDVELLITLRAFQVQNPGYLDPEDGYFSDYNDRKNKFVMIRHYRCRDLVEGSQIGQVKNTGFFFGKGGCNIRRYEWDFNQNLFIFSRKSRLDRGKTTWSVYFSSEVIWERFLACAPGLVLPKIFTPTPGYEPDWTAKNYIKKTDTTVEEQAPVQKSQSFKFSLAASAPEFTPSYRFSPPSGS